MGNDIIKKSQRVYGSLLKLYPKSYRREYGREMQYVFTESVKDAYAANGKPGVATLWAKTVADTGKSAAKQHFESKKENNPMKSKNNDILKDNKIFIWIAVATGLILLIPLLAMLLNLSVPEPGGGVSDKVNWTPGDFAVMGTLIFGISFLFVQVARVTPRKYRVLIGTLFALGFLWLWAELAVGVFTNWGS